MLKHCSIWGKTVFSRSQQNCEGYLFANYLDSASLKTPHILEQLLPVEVVDGMDVDAEEGLQEIAFSKKQSQDQVVLPPLSPAQMPTICCWHLYKDQVNWEEFWLVVMVSPPQKESWPSCKAFSTPASHHLDALSAIEVILGIYGQKFSY